MRNRAAEMERGDPWVDWWMDGSGGKRNRIEYRIEFVRDIDGREGEGGRLREASD